MLDIFLGSTIYPSLRTAPLVHNEILGEASSQWNLLKYGVGNFILPSDKDRVRSKLIRIVIFFSGFGIFFLHFSLVLSFLLVLRHTSF